MHLCCLSCGTLWNSGGPAFGDSPGALWQERMAGEKFPIPFFCYSLALYLTESNIVTDDSYLISDGLWMVCHGYHFHLDNSQITGRGCGRRTWVLAYAGWWQMSLALGICSCVIIFCSSCEHPFLSKKQKKKKTFFRWKHYFCYIYWKSRSVNNSMQCYTRSYQVSWPKMIWGTKQWRLKLRKKYK